MPNDIAETTATTGNTEQNAGAPVMATETPAVAVPAADEAEQTAEKTSAVDAPLMGEGGTEGGTEAKAPDAETKPEAAAENADAPVDYKAQLKAPEGFELNENLLAKAAELFGADKLPPERAQAYVDAYCEMQKEQAEAAAKRSVEAVRAWKTQIEQRPEYAAELPLVRSAIRGMTQENPELKALFNDPVFGNMPELWNLALYVGRKFEQEGALISGGRENGGGKSAADVIFG